LNWWSLISKAFALDNILRKDGRVHALQDQSRHPQAARSGTTRIVFRASGAAVFSGGSRYDSHRVHFVRVLFQTWTKCCQPEADTAVTAVQSRPGEGGVTANTQVFHSEGRSSSAPSSACEHSSRLWLANCYFACRRACNIVLSSGLSLWPLILKALAPDSILARYSH